MQCPQPTPCSSSCSQTRRAAGGPSNWVPAVHMGRPGLSLWLPALARPSHRKHLGNHPADTSFLHSSASLTGKNKPRNVIRAHTHSQEARLYPCSRPSSRWPQLQHHDCAASRGPVEPAGPWEGSRPLAGERACTPGARDRSALGRARGTCGRLTALRPGQR